MRLTPQRVGPTILGKIKIYVLTRAELLFPLCYEIPCIRYLIYLNSFVHFFREIMEGAVNLEVEGSQLNKNQNIIDTTTTTNLISETVSSVKKIICMPHMQ